MSTFPSAVGDLETAFAADRYAQWEQAKETQKNIFLKGRGLLRMGAASSTTVMAATAFALMFPGVVTTVGVAAAVGWSLRDWPQRFAYVGEQRAANRDEARLRDLVENDEKNGFAPVVGEATPLERKRDRLEWKIESNEQRIDTGLKWSSGLAVAGVATLGTAIAAPAAAGLMAFAGATVAVSAVLTGAIIAANALKSRFERGQLARVEAKIEDEAVNGPTPSIIDRLFKRRSASESEKPEQKSERRPSM